MPEMNSDLFVQNVLAALRPMEVELALSGGFNAAPNLSDDVDPEDSERRTALNAARSLIKRPDIRSIICPGLISVASDLKSVAKWITPSLVPLVVKGSIPADPLLVAGISVLIFDAGVATVCEGFNAISKNE